MICELDETETKDNLNQKKIALIWKVWIMLSASHVELVQYVVDYVGNDARQEAGFA